MCSNAITSVFSTPKIDKPAPTPTPATPAVQQADTSARQRAAQAVNANSNTTAYYGDQLDPTTVQRPKLLGS